MKRLRLVMGDQLSHQLSALEGLDQQQDRVLMVEVNEETTYVPHHKQKLVLVLSAMRHFAAELEANGIRVDYVLLDDPANTGSFTSEIERALQRQAIDELVVTEAGEWRVQQQMTQWHTLFDLPVDIRPDTRFLCSLDGFQRWAQGRKSLRMEYFYREMRKSTGWLMQNGKPVGGSWNYDKQNRKALPANTHLPERLRFAPDSITREVMQLVEQHFASNFGALEPFGWAVTRDNALQALEHFIDVCLGQFGDYQDAMKQDQSLLFHSLLSPYLNTGLLEPREVCEAALQAYENGAAPIAAVEGFVRQILGWREYVRGLYWYLMPDYAQGNYFEADRPLPAFYWNGQTEMECVRQAITTTRETAYAHHIQRLMVTGNFALLAGIAPQEVEAWYLAVYIDAFEWVELPNTHGMALFADGGVLASKPYVASGSYINRMSDYCKQCRYSPKEKLGEIACPFNTLYWNFLLQHEQRLRNNPRMAMPYRNVDRLNDETRVAITEQARQFLDQLA